MRQPPADPHPAPAGPEEVPRQRAGTEDPHPKPRFRDIANEAGVGTATVERVLNGRGNVAPATARRVVLAAHKLHYDRTLPSLYHALIRIEVVLVRPETPFFARLNAAFKRSANLLGRSTVLHRTFLEENTPEAIARRIEAIAGTREGVIVVVQDHPRIVAALKALGGRGLPIVLLVSDVPHVGGAVYVGIDNESAGRTAGYFMRHALGSRAGALVTLCHSGAYLTHRQRVQGFSQLFAEPADRLTFSTCLMTRDSDALAYAALSETLRAGPDIVGIYHAGGAQAGALKALGEHRPCGDVVYIGHELSIEVQTALKGRRMLLAIDQQPELQVERALETVGILMGLRPGAPNRSPIPFRIVTPENL